MSDDDRYTYPGSGGVLVNKKNYRDGARLEAWMNAEASVGWASVMETPIPEPPDLTYLATIHRAMLGRVVTWAGRIRDVEVTAVGTGVVYCRHDFLADNLRGFFARLGGEDYLRGLDRATFAETVADRWGELTQLHPFRDGNTRSQSAYVDRLAARAGYQIQWSRVDVDELRVRRLQAITRPSSLAAYLAERIDAVAQGRLAVVRAPWASATSEARPSSSGSETKMKVRADLASAGEQAKVSRKPAADNPDDDEPERRPS